ncbi:MAG TPA: NAD(P)/FAD-dependent oxidoreductase [Kofleriaceae bacterium]|nr:NAD(P)/FAD-dependent oxidoreductase [Kofleriaceae bacterium]
MTRTYDVIVVGAGPAGAATAARLHQHGVEDVLVLERYALPRDKPCGGGLTGHVDEALAALDLRLTVPHVPSASARVQFGSFERTVTMGRPVNVIRRIEFDHSLVEQVRARGVEVVTGEAVDALAVGADAVTLKLGSGRELRAKVVVGADGAASVVRKHLTGNARALPHRLFMHELPADLRDAAMVYDFTPMTAGLRGYLWVFPVSGGRANVGLMHYPSSRRGGPELLRVLRAGLLERHGIELPARGSRGWPVWGYDPGAPVSAPRLLTVGDAAGIDGLTGEGIAVALEQAAVAGDHVARALAGGDVAFKGYRRALRRATVGRELALDRWLARLLYQAGPGWQRWMSLVLFDPDVLEMYAARVSGSEVLADQKLRLWSALGRHWAVAGRRRKQLREAVGDRFMAALRIR